jgi:hypothetical protein
MSRKHRPAIARPVTAAPLSRRSRPGRGVQKFIREASTRRSTQLSINDEVDDSDIVVSGLGGLQ